MTVSVFKQNKTRMKKAAPEQVRREITLQKTGSGGANVTKLGLF